MATPSTVHTATAREHRPPAGGRLQELPMATKQMYAPTMMTSPWAKLSMRAMPYTMV